jgi:ElaB/YqjD/DUF883 family membrane-anchored ribosome-binding protein
MSNRELRKRIEELEKELEEIRDRIDAVLNSDEESEDSELR